jgi:predicted PurR-regulated permease PerM
MLRPFVDVLLWAAVLVTMFYPVHRRLVASSGRPGVSAAVSTLTVIVIVLLPATFITLAVTNELRGAVAGLQGLGERLLDPSSPIVGPALAWASQYVDLERLRSQEFLAERLEGWTSAVANRTVGVVGGVVSALVQMVLVVFTMFYLFRDGENMRHALYDVLPLDRQQSHAIVQRTREVVGATVYGVLVIAAIQGSLGMFIFWALGLPSPLLWGVVMFFLSMIPMAGSFLVWVPAAIFLAATGAYTRAVVLVVWGLVVIGSIDNFLSPRLVGSRTRLHELLVFFSVLGGLQVFGVLGVVLGPVVVAITLALVEMVRQANRPPADTRHEETVLEGQAQLREAPG